MKKLLMVIGAGFAAAVGAGEWTIAQIKEELSAAGVPVRKVW